MKAGEIKAVLARTNPFELLGDDALASLAEKVAVQTYAPGSYVFRQGDPSRDCLFIIARGQVEITLSDGGGQASVAGFRKPYDFFGETVVLSRERYPGGARVREPLVCCTVSRPDLENLIYRNPEFSGFFNALLAERMRLIFKQLAAEQAAQTIGKSEPGLFRRRVSEVMSSPVMTCRPDDAVTAAAGVMDAKKISALVVQDAAGAPVGILTERKLVSTLVARQMFPVDRCTVAKLADNRVATIEPGATLGRAIARMVRAGVRQLPVVERNALVGIVTLFDLVRTRSTGALLVARDIDRQPDIVNLARQGRAVDRILATLVSEKAGIGEILDIMSEMHVRLNRRVIQLAEAQLEQDGMGRPPVPYFWINMGSAARHEQTLRTDQDNAVIYADPPPEKAAEVRRYFEKLAGRVVEGLIQCGFAACPGGVMASKTSWRRSLGEWITALDGWVDSRDPEHTRVLTILLDFRPVWGDRQLADRLQDVIFKAFRESINAGHLLARDGRTFAVPISFLGTIAVEKSGPHKQMLNLKTGGLVHLINSFRILAVKHAVREPSTLGRISRLAAKKVLTADDADFYRSAFETLQMFKTRENVAKFKAGLEADDYIAPGKLGKRERLLLKDALAGVAQLQKLINREFNVFWMNFFE